ncbi:helix-turn-helix domain-containing protein [Limosilactobacillus urinaemulieris]|uniref:winged helix-turn-helix transcriptional regulator n=1 Tax=Limosilactobacillus urinaemulieris TaxID=2742600 RepID=UPI0028E99C4D|nr:helix-turn-helix domain-containing protein [Limosilactobacillus urinaemulieris]
MKDRYLLGIDYLIDVIKGKYKTSIVCQLGKSNQHFEELLRNVNSENHNQVTRKVLSQQLKSLSKSGIVNRRVVDTRPPQTIYSLTTDGQRARQLMVELSIVGEELVKKNSPETTIEYSYGCINH